jgi:hypothetical protein
MMAIAEFAESAHPPLSLRDISPTRGEIVSRQDLTSSTIATSTAADKVLVWGGMAPRVSNLPPRGGDVAKATEGGNAASIFTKAPVQ